MIFRNALGKGGKVTLSVIIIIIVLAGVPFGASISQRNGMGSVQKTKELESVAGKMTSLPQMDKNSFAIMGFLVQGDPQSILAMKKNIKNLDIVVPDWFTFTGGRSEITEKMDEDLFTYLKAQKVEILPRITNVDENDNWQGSEFSHYIHLESNRKELSDQIVAVLEKYQMKGINLDFEALEPQAGGDYLAFLIDLGEKMHKKGMYVTIDVPLYEDAFSYEAICKAVDKVIVMAYDENYAEGSNGPIASKAWFEKGVAYILKKIPAEKAIIALGQYAYDWNTTQKTPARSMGFEAAMALADKVGAKVETDKTAVNSHFSYNDKNGDIHEVWVLDGVSMWNQVLTVMNYKTAGIGLWRLGLEDPSIWEFFRLKDFNWFDTQNLSNIHILQKVTLEGKGEMPKVLGSSTSSLHIADRTFEYL